MIKEIISFRFKDKMKTLFVTQDTNGVLRGVDAEGRWKKYRKDEIEMFLYTKMKTEMLASEVPRQIKLAMR